MSQSDFSIEQALAFGWQSMTGNFGKLLLYIGVPYFVMLALQACIHMLFKNVESLKSLEPITILTNLLLGSVLSLIVMKVGLRVYDKQSLSFGEIMPSWGLIWQYIIGSVIVGLTVLVGTILLVVPGIIWGVRRQFFGFSMIDRGLHAGEAVELSCKITKGQVWHLIGWGLLMMVIHVAGLLCLVIGLLPASLVTFPAQVYIYKQLVASEGAAQENPLVKPA